MSRCPVCDNAVVRRLPRGRRPVFCLRSCARSMEHELRRLRRRAVQDWVDDTDRAVAAIRLAKLVVLGRTRAI